MAKAVILAIVLAVSSAQAVKPQPAPPKAHTKKEHVPKIEYDENCMSYWKDTYDGKILIRHEWIEPSWHDMSEMARRRCQLVI